MRVPFSIVAVGLVACAADAEPELLVPDAVDVAWSDAYDGEQDGLGAVVPLDVLVYDSTTGAPLEGVELAVASEHDGTWVLPSDTLTAIDATDADHAGDDPLARAVETLEASDTLQILFDTRHDRFVTIQANPLDLRTGTTSVTTNVDGVARVLLVVDRFPSGGEGYADVAVAVTAAGDLTLEHVLLLQPN